MILGAYVYQMPQLYSRTHNAKHRNTWQASAYLQTFNCSYPVLFKIHHRSITTSCLVGYPVKPFFDPLLHRYYVFTYHHEFFPLYVHSVPFNFLTFAFIKPCLPANCVRSQGGALRDLVAHGQIIQGRNLRNVYWNSWIVGFQNILPGRDVYILK